MRVCEHRAPIANVVSPGGFRIEQPPPKPVLGERRRGNARDGYNAALTNLQTQPAKRKPATLLLRCPDSGASRGCRM